jgi:exosortase H (IPTLxxWG-CTERM-specific)
MSELRSLLGSAAGHFVARYVVLIVALFAVMAWRPVNDHVVDPYTTFVAHEAAVVLRALGEGIRVDGQVLSSPRFAVTIYNGCNGLEAILVFVAGVLAFPAPWRARVLGVVTGFVAVQVLNVVRVVSLYYVGVWRPDWFTTAHVLVWQTVVILFAVILWLFWVQRHALAAARV